MTEREKIAAKIRALLAKTVENGCTEEEAIAAAAKAAEMLARYNMTIDEAQLRESPFKKAEEQYADLVGDRLWKVASAIAYMVGCKNWSSSAGVYPVTITFFGFEHEVEIATYLLEICRRAMRDGEKMIAARYALMIPVRRRSKILPFLDGMADSLSRRIRTLKGVELTGKGLVPVRNQLIDAALKDAGINLENKRTRGSRDGDTYGEGVRAGNRVSLNTGVSGPSESTLRIQ